MTPRQSAAAAAASDDSQKVLRTSKLVWHRLGDLEVLPEAQRKYREEKAAKFAAELDLEGLGYPVVNVFDGRKYIVDGQHRIGALKIFGFTDDDVIQCETYYDLSEAEMAQMFLLRDNRTAVGAFDKYRLAITAQDDIALDIDRIVRAQGLRVTSAGGERAVRCVSKLGIVYDLAGAAGLGHTLRLLRDSWGGTGASFDAPLVHGMGLVVHRYGKGIDDLRMTGRLMKVPGASGGLIAKGETIRRATQRSRAHCVAAAIVETYNAGRGPGTKLDNWWA